MSERKAWIPLSEPEELLELSNGAVVNHLALPVGLEADRIELHPGRIERLGRLAGAKQIHLQLFDRSAAAEFDAHDVHVSEGGVAVASGLRQKDKKPKADISFDDNGHPYQDLISLVDSVHSNDTERSNRLTQLFQIYKADSVGFYIPRSGAEQRVKDYRKNQRGLLDEPAWASVLNKEIKDAAITAATLRYLTSSRFRNFFDPLSELLLKTWVITDLIDGNYVWPAIILTGSNLRRAGQFYRVTSKQAELRDFNPSIFNDLRIDRIAATAIVAKLGKVARYAK